MANFSEKRNILHLVIWILALVAACLLADTVLIRVDYTKVGSGIYENQFVNAAIFGYCIVACLMFGAILFEEQIPEKTLYLLNAGGTALYFTAAMILFVCYDKIRNSSSTSVSTRVLVDGVLSAVLGFLHLFELIASLTKKSLLE